MPRASQRPIFLTVLLLAGLVFGTVTPAQATAIFPGDTNIVPTTYNQPGGPITFLFDSGHQFLTFGSPGFQFTVAFEEYVVLDPFSSHLYSCGGNCLDFALDATLVSGPPVATTTLNSITIGAFGGAGASIDVGYLTDTSSAPAPSTANRAPTPNSGVITFNYTGGIPAGSDTKTLLLRTDLTNWDGQTNITFNTTEVFPGRDPFHLAGTASVTTPEPSSMLLLGSGLLLALRRTTRT